MIISASRRTDISAFHSEWFMNRLREGYSITTHRPGTKTYYRVPLTPDVVDCIVFRTKNPAPMLAHLDALQEYNYLFNITMNPYESEMETNLPRLQDRVETYKKLASKIGPLRMIWRYDPIMISSKYDLDFHTRAFEYLCRELQGTSYKCMIGFIEHHPFSDKRIAPLEVSGRDDDDVRICGQIFGETAHRYGIRIETCGEPSNLDQFGIARGACVDREQIEQIVGYRLDGIREKYQLRPHCNCIESIDIGHYSTCGNGCLYCYATQRKIRLDIDPLSPSLDPAFDITQANIVETACRSFRSVQGALW